MFCIDLKMIVATLPKIKIIAGVINDWDKYVINASGLDENEIIDKKNETTAVIL